MTPNKDELFAAVVSDASELAVLGKALARRELADALRPFAFRIAAGVLAAAFGLAGIVDLIKLAVALLLGGDVGFSVPWLGWSACTLVALASLIGVFGAAGVRFKFKRAGAALETRSSPA